MERMFSDLVVSRGGTTARRGGLALPASLALHAAVATLVVFVAAFRQSALPVVEAPPGHIPGFIPPRLGGAPAPRPGPPRLPRPTPPPAMVVLPLRPAPPEPEDLGGPDLAPDAAPDGAPCLGCEPGGVPDGVPGGDPSGTGPGTSPRPSTEPARTGGDIHPPLKVRHVVPVYPEIARSARVQGDVVLDCTISNEGRVVGVKVLSGHPLLQGAAVDAVRQWLYRPTLLNGVPIAVVMTVTVRFTIDRSR
jgi:periplasmic protein TonB